MLYSNATASKHPSEASEAVGQDDKGQQSRLLLVSHKTSSRRPFQADRSFGLAATASLRA
jgi:hypothetical protein